MEKLHTSKFKLIVKVLTLLLVMIVSNSWGQATIPVTRTAWGTTPTGWIDSGTGTYTTSFACSGNDGGQLSSTGDYYQIFYSSGASNLSFVTKSVSAYTGTFDVQESPDGSAWTTVASYTAMSTACVTNTLTLNCLSRYVRFYYTTRVVNITIDDVSITQGTCCAPPTITITPTSQTVCAGSAVTLTVTNSATIPSYTWQASSNGTNGWANVANGTPAGASYSGVNTSTLAITAGSTSTTYYYHSLVTENGTCTATSGSSTLVVNTNPTITTQPVNRTICSETNTTFAVIASGGIISYQWQEKIPAGSFVNVSNGGVYSGVTAATLTLTNVPSSMNTYSYQCILNVASCSSVTTAVVTLSVNASPAAPPTPTALANPACGGTTLTAMPSTVTGVVWYWQSTSSAGTTNANPTSNTYYVGATATYYVRARANSPVCWSATSSNILVTINQAPIVTAQPTDVSICDPSNTSFAIVASNTTGYQWQVDNGGGFVNCSAAPYSNFTTNSLTITGATLGMNGYKYRCIVTGSAPCASVASNTAKLTITAALDPTTAATSPIVSSIGCNAFKLSWTIGNGSNRLVVVKAASVVAGSPTDGTSYVASSTFGSGGTIAAGEFVVYNGTGSSVFVTGLSASAVYFYKIFEFNGCGFNYLTSGTVPSGSLTTTSCATYPAGITAVYIDACGNAVCPSEGSNELIWGTTGSYGMAVNNNGPTLSYSVGTPPTAIMISTYAQNADNVTALNTAVGACGTTTFIDPNTQGYMPPNSRFLIANNCICIPSVYDFSGLCGKGPIYVVFGTDAAWTCNTSGGIFGNWSSGGTVRYFDLNMNAWGVALDPIYNYTVGSLSNGGDGDIILTDPIGGAAKTYSNSACKVPLIVLPIDLLDFYATKNGKKNDVVWKVVSEINVVYYIIEKSNDGVNFTELTTVFTNNTTQRKTYSVVDDSPFDDITYYRLGTKEKDGKINYYKIISVDEKSTHWNYYHYHQNQSLVIEFKNTIPKNSTITLFDLSGKLLVEQAVNESQIKINTQAFADGIYFVKITTPYKIENFKIIITK